MKTKMFVLNFFLNLRCPHIKKNKCKAMSKCKFAHSEEELRPKPDFTRTSMCPNVNCKKKHCRYAHSSSELRSTEDYWKIELCRDFMNGGCQFSMDKCRFAHGECDLQIKKDWSSMKTPSTLPTSRYSSSYIFTPDEVNSSIVNELTTRRTRLKIYNRAIQDYSSAPSISMSSPMNLSRFGSSAEIAPQEMCKCRSQDQYQVQPAEYDHDINNHNLENNQMNAVFSDRSPLSVFTSSCSAAANSEQGDNDDYVNGNADHFNVEEEFKIANAIQPNFISPHLQGDNDDLTSIEQPPQNQSQNNGFDSAPKPNQLGSFFYDNAPVQQPLHLMVCPSPILKPVFQYHVFGGGLYRLPVLVGVDRNTFCNFECPF